MGGAISGRLMKKVSTSIERWASNHFPNFYLKLVQQPRNYFKFRTERALSRGATLSKSQHPSIIFFTTQKCASRYVDQVMNHLALAEGMVHADYDAYVTMVQMPFEDRPFANPQNMRTAFVQTGYYYGPIGTYREIPDLDQFRVILQLRDPRDLLTSLYFSTAFSHAVINPKVIRRRREALGMDIDTFVLHAADEYLPIFTQYSELLIGGKSVLFLRYEDMVADFQGWLKRLSLHAQLNQKSEILDRIQKESDFSVENEDKFSQRRQITPGDHIRKLRPVTISRLTQLFEPVLDKFGYTS